MTTTSSGSTLEQTVRGTLESKGFTVVAYRDWAKNSKKYGSELLLMHVPYRTIYEHGGYTEYLLKSKKYKLSVRIECKWQQRSGSVDEKLAYLYLNALQVPEDDMIIVIDGPGFKKGAIQWLRNAVATRKYIEQDSPEKRILVFNLAEFLTWANKIFR
ncbi:MAG: 4-diphosphocytidyl-2C-methyl-D-erythritol kinase [Candidatus Doudnabacteria bacterium]|nr:4-diphosphocytidyl-2C-methyl-D-erythritol kinase [Candidatus Doudnabacteria bacterium]